MPACVDWSVLVFMPVQAMGRVHTRFCLCSASTERPAHGHTQTRVSPLCRRYIASMVDMFGRCSERGMAVLRESAQQGQAVEMENYFSRLTLDIIGKAVFNYEFDALRHEDPVIQVGGACEARAACQDSLGAFRPDR